MEPPPVVIHALLRRSCVRGVAVDPDTVIAPGSHLEMLITKPVLRYHAWTAAMFFFFISCFTTPSRVACRPRA